jgi:murein DD-endopeptidase MepM/ murein hydrolase activator NlpD
MFKTFKKSSGFPVFCLCLMLFVLYPAFGRALTLALPETAYQGDLIIGSVHPDARVRLKDHLLPVGPGGHFAVAVPRDQKKDLRVTAFHNDQDASHIIRIWAYPWQTQRIDGLPQHYVVPNAEQQKQIHADAEKIRSVRNYRPYPIPLFIKKGFVKPVTGSVSSPFGSRRILNGLPRNPHSGVDIAAPLGKPVHSPADGIVTLAINNMFLMGNTLMMDHGLGVSSIFIHLERIHVHVGDVVRQGDIIADVGKSGRATGPHLHWGVYVGSIAVDPLRLLKNRF